MNVKKLQTGAVGIKVTQMDCVSMTESYSIEQQAVVIQRS